MLRCENRFAFQFLDKLRVKGKPQPVTVYLPMSRAAEAARQEEIALWQTATRHYSEGVFNDATRAFDELCRRFPEARLYAVYQARAEFLLNNPQPTWDGIWAAQKK